MLCNISRLMVVVLLVMLIVGCQSKTPSPNSSSAEELRLLTPEQEKKLIESAERVEEKDAVRQPLRNDKGEVVGTISSQTRVIFLKSGGRFNTITTCNSSCSSIVVGESCGTSGCDAKNGNCTPGSCTGGQCVPSCGKTSTGFGNFGIFIAMDRDNPLNTSVAHK